LGRADCQVRLRARGDKWTDLTRHTHSPRIGTTLGTAGEGATDMCRLQTPTTAAWCVFRIHRFSLENDTQLMGVNDTPFHTALFCIGLLNNSR
jgi:hypothetical protein